MSQMKTRGSIGTRSKTWPLWTNIVKIIRNSNWAEEYARIHWKRSSSGKENLVFSSVARIWIHYAKTGFWALNRVQNLFRVLISLFLAILILGLVVWMGISLEPRARLSEAMWYVSLSLGLN